MDIVDRFPLYPILFSFLLYPVLAWIVLRIPHWKTKMRVFATLNVCGLAVLCILSGAKSVRANKVLPYSKVALLFFAMYVAVVLVHYAVLRLCRRENTIWPTAAFVLPILGLGYIKYLSDALNPFGAILQPLGLVRFGVFFIGISYLSFRLVHLVQEVRNQLVEMPSLSEYLAFAFFVPTLSIGPISPYSLFLGSLKLPNREKTPIARSLLRIVVGWTKYIFLGSVIAQFTYAGLLRDGHPHGWIDLVIAVPAYALYLYCNFSGFCDMVIGVSGLLDIQIAENFDRPFTSRNFQEFWTRWHITLSTWIRDLIFTPLSKSLMRRFGAKSANHSIAVTILLSFLAVGIWHGKGLNFLVFGFLQGVGLVTVHYYTVWLKKRLGREKFAAYRKSAVILFAGRVLTFSYFAFTLFFVANTWDDMRLIREALMQR